MKFITVSELRADAPKIVAELERTGEEVVITKKGKPVAILQRVKEEKFMLKPEENENEKSDRDRSLSKGQNLVDTVHRSKRQAGA